MPQRRSVVFLLWAVFLLGNLYPHALHAQGTLVPDAPTSVVVVTRDDILRTGLNDLSDVLRQLPAVTGSPLSSRSNRAIDNLVRDSFLEPNTRGADGSTRTDLRGLGPDRTLVLIDGKRDITNGDFSLIPLALVERIEISLDSDTTAYGANAVAGVINIITRQRFEGIELQAQYGRAFGLIDNPAAQLNPAFNGSDGDAGRVSGIYGWQYNRGSVVVGAEYNDQSGVFQGNVDNPQFNRAISVLDSDDLAAAGFRGSLNTDLDGDGIVGVSDNGGSAAGLGGFFCTASQGLNCDSPTTFDPVSGMLRPFDAETDLFNASEFNLLQTAFERTNAFLNTEYQITDSITAHIDARYSLRDSRQEFPPPAFLSGFFNRLPDDIEDFVFAGEITADNPFNPFGEDVVDARGRLPQVRSINRQEIEQFSVNVGFNGRFSNSLPDWQWRASWAFGDSAQSGVSGLDIDALAFVLGITEIVLGNDGQITCDPMVLSFRNCTPVNIFRGFGNISDEQIFTRSDGASVNLFPLADVKNNLHTVDAGISGKLLTLPTGPVSTTFGYQFRYQDSDTDNSLFSCDSCSLFSPFARFEGDAFQVHSGFANIEVPILKDAHLAELLTFNAGVRYDSYSYGPDNTSFDLNLNWQIVSELSLHGSVSEVFREPTINELSLLAIDAFPFFLDVCRSSASIINDTTNSFANLTPEQQQQCIETGVEITGMDADGNPLTFDLTGVQPRARVGGNQNLGLETGTHFRTGLKFAPPTVPGLTLSLDYWNIELNNTIVFPDPERIFNGCIFGGVNALCDRITRANTIFTGNPSEIFSIDAALSNLGRETADGIDLSVSHDQVTSWGQFNSRLLITWLNERTSTSFAFAGTNGFDPNDGHNLAGTFSNAENLSPSVYPEWKGLFTLDWQLAELSAGLSLEYLSGTDEVLDSNSSLINRIGSEFYADFSLSYTLPFGTTMTGGITNIFDNDPPFIANALNAFTDTDTYRVLGRSWFVRLTQRF